MRYLLFAGDRYYPDGGWLDYKMGFDWLEDALSAATGLDSDYNWWQVVDVEATEIVKSKETPEQR